MEYFWEKERSISNGEIRILKEDIKKRLNFPETYKYKKTVWFDLGKKYIFNVSYIAKNAFGVPIENVAKYELDFENYEYTLIEIID